MDPLYRNHLEYISRQRLAAATVRASTDDGEFEAAVLLWDTARAEARALRSLPAPSAETALRSAIEQCGLLLEARAVSAVLVDAWPEVLIRAQDVPPEVAKVLCARLRDAAAMLSAEVRSFAAAQPGLAQFAEAALSRSATARATAIPALRAYVSRFPGDSTAWFNLALLCRLAGDAGEGFDAITRTRRLDPEFEPARDSELAMAIDVVSPEQLRRLTAERLRDVISGNGTAELAYAVAIALTQLAQKDGSRADLEEAHRVCEKGLLLATRRTETWRYLRVTKAVLDDLLAQREPRPEAFDEAGLPQAGQHARKAGALSALRARPPRSLVDLPIAV